jgi:Holliday junction resolvase-like predicted endonuclease
MPWQDLWPLPVLILGLLAVVVLLWSMLMQERGKASRASKRRVHRAQQGERQAVALLQAAGYRVLEQQLRGRWWIEVDGEQHPVDVIADLLVERDGWSYIAEVKTGELATDPTRPATRRQLLEYLLAFEPDGLLLVDMDQGTIHDIGFPGLEE